MYRPAFNGNVIILESGAYKNNTFALNKYLYNESQPG